MFNFKEIASVTLILFSVIDIIGSIPVVIDLKKRAGGTIQAGKATIVSGIIMVIFLFLGQSILSLFDLDVESFAVAGGLIMFILGMEMILGVRIFKENADDSGSASIVPLAFPIIAGAGTMTTILALRAEYEVYNILVGIALNIVFVYLVLRSSGWLERKLGPGGFNILRKVFGIILLAISIKLIKSNLLGL